MKSSKLVSVIIPCYNDGQYINPIIKALKKSNYVGEIIVVDNNSLPYTQDILKKISGIKLLINQQNVGKTRSLKRGVLASAYDYIAFIDCDLIGFTTADFDNLVMPVLGTVCDITISYRGREAWYGLTSGFAIAYTGERAIKKELLEENIDLFDNPGYIIEAEFNKRFLGKTKMHAVLWKNVGQWGQPQKNGLKGWLVNWHQVTSFIKYLGLFEMLRQLVYVKLPGFVLKS